MGAAPRFKLNLLGEVRLPGNDRRRKREHERVINQPARSLRPCSQRRGERMNAPAKARHLYFAYGSNLSVEQMQERCPDSQPWRTAHLAGYRLAFGNTSSYRKGGVATILPDGNGHHTQGLLYRLSNADLAKLDNWEAYPKRYDRFRPELIDADGVVHSAWTYWLKDYSPNSPSEEYLGIIKAGYKTHGLDLENLFRAMGPSTEKNRGAQI